jgi:hypothetical protein
MVGGFLYGAGEECTWLNGTLLQTCPYSFFQLSRLNADPAQDSSSFDDASVTVRGGGRFRRPQKLAAGECAALICCQAAAG